MSTKRKIAAAICLGLILGVMALIWNFSAQPGVQSGALSQSVQQNMQQKGLDKLTPNLGFLTAQQAVRKWAHAYIYALLGALCAAECWVLRPVSHLPQKIATLLAPLGACAAWAALDECHQYFVPGRSCQLRDVGVDSLGALAGILLVGALVKLVGWLQKKLRRPR